MEPQNIQIVGVTTGSSIPVTHGIMSSKKGAIGANTSMTHDEFIEWQKTEWVKILEKVEQNPIDGVTISKIGFATK
jgi:hypothetical protein